MTVMTVLGPVEGEALGRVDAHEHLFLRSPVLPGEEFQDLGKMVRGACCARMPVGQGWMCWAARSCRG